MNNVLLSKLIGSLNSQKHADALAAGFFSSPSLVSVEDVEQEVIVVLDENPTFYVAIYFDSLTELTNEAMQSFFSLFPSDKPLRTAVTTDCGYLMRHGTSDERAEQILDCYLAVFPDANVQKTLENEIIKGRINYSHGS